MLGWKRWSTKDAVFPCLRELYIESCPQLVEVSAESLPLLRVLKISKSGHHVLRSLVQAASSITMLEILDISGLTYEVWSGVMEHIGAVEEVSIEECNEIRYLWESEEEASKVLVNIKKLVVYNCSNLVSLGKKEEEDKDNFGSSLLSSLRALDVCECNKMERCCCPNSIESLHIKWCRSLTHVSFPTAATGGGGGGQKLKSLEIYGCSKLMEKINNISMGVLERIDIGVWINLKSLMQLGNFIYLTQLYLYKCPSLESFPDIPLPVLTCLEIEDCERMESFSAHQMSNNLTSLKELVIRDCPSIDASSHVGVWPPNLCSLEIGRLKNPMTEWGPQSFSSSLVDLKLYYDADVKNFRQLSHLLLPSSLTKLRIYNFEKLESLSMGLQHLTSLQHLTIKYCPKMKHLPKHLTSLQHLTIWGCPKIKHLPKQLLPSLLSLEIVYCPKLRKNPLISHIPDIIMNELKEASAVATFSWVSKKELGILAQHLRTEAVKKRNSSKRNGRTKLDWAVAIATFNWVSKEEVGMLAQQTQWQNKIGTPLKRNLEHNNEYE
ncbi:hypothetical protein M8C21_009179 [Ambrosia artemisiifolia]|uniref:Uncharacterized protein n=1 Tax=Ambrosia artemisiifolia TaxID=4212 RepID=A0AAD5G7W9_AMBAR|nr:hypothetical protein M8C21_009179 [Ambrosia artemisiifolia]